MYIKKFILLAGIISLNLFSFAQHWYSIRSDEPSPAGIHLINSNSSETNLQVNINGFYYSTIPVNGEKTYKLSLGNTACFLEKGNPELLKLTTSLIIPEYSSMKVKVRESHFIEIKNFVIIPSKGNLTRDIDPSTVPWEFSDIYNQNTFYPSSLVELSKPYIFRDFHGQTLIINPFRYNPVTKTLRVYYSISLSVEPQNPLITEIQLPQVIQEDFNQIYQRHFINYSSLSAKYTPISDIGKMLIISHPNFLQAMQPLADWKNTTGTQTEIVSLATIGTTSAAIKSFISNYYNTNGLTFVLLVGDAQFVPTNNTSSGHSDNAYGYLLGNDSYPELFVGRFSAETVAHTQTMVQRTIEYEKNPQYQNNWLNKAIGIASDEGPGDNNEMDFEHVRIMLNKMMAYTYTGNYELYEGSQGGNDASGNPTAAMLTNTLHNGAGVILYTGHGSSSSFVTTSFNNANINNLTNTGKLPFIFSVACVNGDFVGKTCFAETWLRATNSDQPTGAIATLMSTINQSWNPPMAGQDEMVDILVESYQNNIKRSFGGISVNGMMKMNDQYGSAGTTITDTWIIFGDPSLNIRTDTPKVITATHPQTIVLGTSMLQVFSPVSGAKATISHNGQYISHTVFQGGTANINLGNLNAGDTITLAVTAFNYIPYLAEIQVVIPTGPFMVLKSISVNDPTGNNNGMADYGETIELNVELENIGVTLAEGVHIVLSTSSSSATITDSAEYAGNIMSNATSTRSSAFSMLIAPVVTNQEILPLTLTMKDTNNVIWSSMTNLILNAPELVATQLIIKDTIIGNNNGRIEPGETAAVTIRTTNLGHSDAQQSYATLYESSTFSDMLVFSANTPPILSGSFVDATFVIRVDQAIPLGTSIGLNFNLIAGDYSATETFYVSTSDLIEDWESNSLTSFPWVNDNNKPWVLNTTAPFDGLYSARSGLTSNDHNKKSELSITINSLVDDTISFYLRTSCEAGYGNWYDYLEFFIENVSQGKWDGNTSWQKVSYPISQGQHTLKWVYSKDFYLSSGQDAAWIDNIKFPPLATPAVIAKVQDNFDMFAFPNPVKNYLTLSFTMPAEQETSVSIYNVHGQLVKNMQIEPMSYSAHIDLENLPDGIYILFIYSQHQTKSLKFVKTD